MPRYQTIVIEYDDEQPPFRFPGVKVNGMEIIALSSNHALNEVLALEAKVEILQNELKAWEYDNG